MKCRHYFEGFYHRWCRMVEFLLFSCINVDVNIYGIRVFRKPKISLGGLSNHFHHTILLTHEITLTNNERTYRTNEQANCMVIIYAYYTTYSQCCVCGGGLKGSFCGRCGWRCLCCLLINYTKHIDYVCMYIIRYRIVLVTLSHLGWVHNS